MNRIVFYFLALLCFLLVFSHLFRTVNFMNFWWSNKNRRTSWLLCWLVGGYYFKSLSNKKNFFSYIFIPFLELLKVNIKNHVFFSVHLFVVFGFLVDHHKFMATSFSGCYWLVYPYEVFLIIIRQDI